MIPNKNAFHPTTVSLKISDTQIKKHLRDHRVRQLKDVRASLYLKFNKKRSGGTWVLMEYKGGKQCAHRIGKWPSTQAQDVMNVVSTVSDRIAAGEPAEFKSFETVDELIEWHVKRETKLARSTAQRLTNIKSMSEQHICPTFEGFPLMQINHQVVDKRLIQEMLGQGYSLSYVRANFNLLKTAYSSAKMLKEITINPMADVRFKDFFPTNFSITKAQVKGCKLNTEQLPVVLRDVTDSDPQKRALLIMLIAHGTRIGETRMAKWEHVDLTRRCWTIPKENSKNGNAIVYPLTEGVVEFLCSYRKWQVELGFNGKYLFPVSRWSNDHITGNTASEWVRDVSKRQWSAHDIRKRARTIWLELGIDYIVCEALLNHAKDKLDQVYIHSHMELQKKEALETYHEWLKSCWQTCLCPISTTKSTRH
ncbi:tyrosine-type recombinase/integrase [Grimontia hollisae]|uniref:tyrosine-type recombinase/integrase n=1 Tax=Grimontia hollisae TaxID=673 RepID=UPI001302F8A8|nr:site-specific integrase [Grimontia hollisae]